MPQLLVRNINESLVSKLKKRARANGVSAEEEHRRILQSVLNRPVEEKPSFIDFLTDSKGVEPDIEINIARSTTIEDRDIEL